MSETEIKSAGKIYMGCDKDSYEWKNVLKLYLENLNFLVIDLGAFEIEEVVDYPVLGREVAEKVLENEDLCDDVNLNVKDGEKGDTDVDDNKIYGCQVYGVLLNTNGIGMLTAANEVKGIRSVFAKSLEDAEKAKKEDARVVCLATKEVSLEQAKEIIKSFITREN